MHPIAPGRHLLWYAVCFLVMLKLAQAKVECHVPWEFKNTQTGKCVLCRLCNTTAAPGADNENDSYIQRSCMDMNSRRRLSGFHLSCWARYPSDEDKLPEPRCETLKQPQYGRLRCDRENKVGSTCEVICDNHHLPEPHHSIQCHHSKNDEFVFTWSHRLPQCKPVAASPNSPIHSASVLPIPSPSPSNSPSVPQTKFPSEGNSGIFPSQSAVFLNKSEGPSSAQKLLTEKEVRQPDSVSSFNVLIIVGSVVLAATFTVTFAGLYCRRLRGRPRGPSTASSIDGSASNTSSEPAYEMVSFRSLPCPSVSRPHVMFGNAEYTSLDLGHTTTVPEVQTNSYIPSRTQLNYTSHEEARALLHSGQTIERNRGDYQLSHTDGHDTDRTAVEHEYNTSSTGSNGPCRHSIRPSCIPRVHACLGQQSYQVAADTDSTFVKAVSNPTEIDDDMSQAVFRVQVDRQYAGSRPIPTERSFYSIDNSGPAISITTDSLSTVPHSDPRTYPCIGQETSGQDHLFVEEYKQGTNWILELKRTDRGNPRKAKQNIFWRHVETGCLYPHRVVLQEQYYITNDLYHWRAWWVAESTGRPHYQEGFYRLGSHSGRSSMGQSLGYSTEESEVCPPEQALQLLSSECSSDLLWHICGSALMTSTSEETGHRASPAVHSCYNAKPGLDVSVWLDKPIQETQSKSSLLCDQNTTSTDNTSCKQPVSHVDKKCSMRLRELLDDVTFMSYLAMLMDPSQLFKAVGAKLGSMSESQLKHIEYTMRGSGNCTSEIIRIICQRYPGARVVDLIRFLAEKNRLDVLELIRVRHDACAACLSFYNKCNVRRLQDCKSIKQRRAFYYYYLQGMESCKFKLRDLLEKAAYYELREEMKVQLDPRPNVWGMIGQTLAGLTQGFLDHTKYHRGQEGSPTLEVLNVIHALYPQMTVASLVNCLKDCSDSGSIEIRNRIIRIHPCPYCSSL